MNIQECDIVNNIMEYTYKSQRELAEQSGHSIGIVNRSIKELIENQYLDEEKQPTAKAIKELDRRSPKNAVILAAGFGMRMVPINMELPKGLIEVNGEVLIERIIRQLHEVGIEEICVVVGFMKESYEYLIDEFGVELIVNQNYKEKNNLHSLNLVADRLNNTYIIPCDIWCASNPFSKYELYSWYMVSDRKNDESEVFVNRKKELIRTKEGVSGNAMIGICYLVEEEADFVCKCLKKYAGDKHYDDAYWEEALYNQERMIVSAKEVSSMDAVEINTYEQLRELDQDSNHLKSEAISTAAEALDVSELDIEDIQVLKKGMTNRSFLFACNGQKYIMRIPGKGTEKLINRAQEADVYHEVEGKGICDDIVYMNPENGYKISKYLTGARVCNPLDKKELSACMEKLRDFHNLKLKVNHTFDIFAQIDFYESLWGNTPSAYKDYQKTKENVYSLIPYIEKNVKEKVLTHIDAVPDNFLFVDSDGKTELRLIDWEYAGMQDPHVDIAMFCIYALYTRAQVDQLIDIYFEENCQKEIRLKIYAYIAACGLLWSNWCEYKRHLGIDFGEYSLCQYRYAKDYYKIVCKELEEE